MEEKYRRKKSSYGRNRNTTYVSRTSRLIESVFVSELEKLSVLEKVFRFLGFSLGFYVFKDFRF